MLVKTRLDMLSSCWWGGVALALWRGAMKTFTKLVKVFMAPINSARA